MNQDRPLTSAKSRYSCLALALALEISLLGCGGTTSAPAKTPPVAKKAQARVARDPAPPERSESPVVVEPADPKQGGPEPAVPAQVIHRPRDTRPVRDDKELARRGFIKISSERLILYSDLPEKELAGLTEVVARLCNLMEAYFGPLPPGSPDKPYQMTGYLMGDAQKFRDAGILTEGPAQPHEGWYLGNEFWLNRQATEYYTRHLMLHEAAHCFMHVMPAVDCPPWYVEGMAELFGTHGKNDEGQWLFGIFPDNPDRNPGWARVSVLQEEIAAGRLADMDQIIHYKFNEFSKLPPYAWSWALCHYLNTHPRYKVPFQELAKRLYDGGFTGQWKLLFDPFMADLRDEWLLYASQIQYGHDIHHSVIDFKSGQDLTAGKPQLATVSSTVGWQSAQVKLSAGRTYRLRATGQFTLAFTKKPWISEPQGISVRYFAGQPLGRLMGTIRPEPSGDTSNRDILKFIPLGPDTTFVAPHSGTLYLRLNDVWNALEDNDGEVKVELELAGGK